MATLLQCLVGRSDHCGKKEQNFETMQQHATAQSETQNQTDACRFLTFYQFTECEIRPCGAAHVKNPRMRGGSSTGFRGVLTKLKLQNSSPQTEKSVRLPQDLAKIAVGGGGPESVSPPLHQSLCFHQAPCKLRSHPANLLNLPDSLRVPPGSRRNAHVRAPPVPVARARVS